MDIKKAVLIVPVTLALTSHDISALEQSARLFGKAWTTAKNFWARSLTPQKCKNTVEKNIWTAELKSKKKILPMKFKEFKGAEQPDKRKYGSISSSVLAFKNENSSTSSDSSNSKTGSTANDYLSRPMLNNPYDPSKPIIASELVESSTPLKIIDHKLDLLKLRSNAGDENRFSEVINNENDIVNNNEEIIINNDKWDGIPGTGISINKNNTNGVDNNITPNFIQAKQSGNAMSLLENSPFKDISMDNVLQNDTAINKKESECQKPEAPIMLEPNTTTNILNESNNVNNNINDKQRSQVVNINAISNNQSAVDETKETVDQNNWDNTININSVGFQNLEVSDRKSASIDLLHMYSQDNRRAFNQDGIIFKADYYSNLHRQEQDEVQGNQFAANYFLIPQKQLIERVHEESLIPSQLNKLIFKTKSFAKRAVRPLHFLMNKIKESSFARKVMLIPTIVYPVNKIANSISYLKGNVQRLPKYVKQLYAKCREIQEYDNYKKLLAIIQLASGR